MACKQGVCGALARNEWQVHNAHCKIQTHSPPSMHLALTGNGFLPFPDHGMHLPCWLKVVITEASQLDTAGRGCHQVPFFGFMTFVLRSDVCSLVNWEQLRNEQVSTGRSILE